MNSEGYLEQLRAAYAKWLGAPEDIVKMRRASPDGIAPDEIDILFFLPIAGPNEDNITTVATAGMSSRQQLGPYPHVELALELKGAVPESDRPILARNLADLASVPFRERRPFHPNSVLEGVKLHPFDKMTFGLLSKWDILQDVTLSDVDPPVYVLRLTPLHENEAALAERIGDVNALTQLQHNGMIPEDFRREPTSV
jgi:Suppressor of fused protein (SUFU)